MFEIPPKRMHSHPALAAILAVALAAFTVHVSGYEQWASSWERAIDAPWRMEPRPNPDGPGFVYGAIPVSVLINDAMAFEYTPDCGILEFNDLTNCDREETQLKRVVSIRIWERTLGQAFPTNPSASFPAADFHHTESTLGPWRLDTPAMEGDDFEWLDLPPEYPRHWEHPLQTHEVVQSVCNHWDGEVCDDWTPASLEDTSEWSTTVYYDPAITTPGTDLFLRVTVRIEYYDGEDNEMRFGDITQELKVHLGEAPLPSFGSTWAYGDIHHHAQGTDNGGEVGNSYRNTLHAMNAIGLDFVFATDHANNNAQMGWGTLGIGVDWAWNPANWQAAVSLEDHYFGLGDMSGNRWTNHWYLLNGVEGNPYTGEEGANVARQVLSYPRLRTAQSLAVPQIFLGGEVDIVPEVLPGQNYAGMVYGGTMHLESIGWSLPDEIYRDPLGQSHNLKRIIADASSTDLLECGSWFNNGGCHYICELDDILAPTGDGTMKVRDIQATTLDNARQHLLHLPRSSTRDDTGIISDTNDYGGASRRLKDLLATEYEAAQKGYFFMAHPVNAASGHGTGRLGPDIVPYSEVQLKEAFASEYFLGLQAWNENERLLSEIDHGAARDDLHSQYHDDGAFDYFAFPAANQSTWNHFEFVDYRLDETLAGVRLWDAMLLWSLDPAMNAPLTWLDEGEPRKVFMAGGSDSHGDFNFRREGYLLGPTAFNDTALGKPRNLLNAGDPVGRAGSVDAMGGNAFSQEQIVDTFRSGQFAVTDGPALRIAIDTNGDGLIDSGDIPMGGTAHGRFAPTDGSTFPTGDTFPLLVEWKSTEEFGPVSRLDLTLGAFSDIHRQGTLWGPESYGKGQQVETFTLAGETYERYVYPQHSEDGYWHVGDYVGIYEGGACAFDGRTLQVHIQRPKSNPNAPHPGFEGTCRFTIDPSLFPDLTVTPVIDAAPVLTAADFPGALFVRADVHTDPVAYRGTDVCGQYDRFDRCVARMAFSNPVWIMGSVDDSVQDFEVAAHCVDDDGALTADNRLTWRAMPEATGYELWTSDEQTLLWEGPGGLDGGTVTLHAAVEEAVQVKVRAVSALGASDFSRVRHLDNDPCGWNPTTPVDVTIAPQCDSGDNRNRMAWDPVPFAKEYEVWTADETQILASSPIAAATVQVDEDVSVKVMACNELACSGFSGAVLAEANPCREAPDPVLSVEVTAHCPSHRDGGVLSLNQLSWEPSPFAETYELWPEGWSIPLWTGSNPWTTVAVDTGTQARIKACNSYGCSLPSAPVLLERNPCQVPPVTPTGWAVLPMCEDRDGTLLVGNRGSWDATHVADTYEIWTANGAQRLWFGFDTLAYFTVATDMEVKVKACNLYGCGGFSPGAMAESDPCGPGGPTGPRR